jgi:hypothetical protein
MDCTLAAGAPQKSCVFIEQTVREEDDSSTTMVTEAF